MSDSRELAHVPSQSNTLLAQIVEAAKDPSVDAGKMQAMANLAISLQDRERQIQFNIDKNAALKEMPVITKDGRIIITKDGNTREQGRFAKFEDIDRVCRPILASHNLAISFKMNERQGGGITVTPILSHANGLTEEGGAFPVPPETSGSKNAAQAMGSSSSYGKRYAYCAILNIVTEGVDDDGNMGRGRQAVASSLTFEREQAVRADALAAHEAGGYTEWFSRQSPKDRSWLISSGLHEQYGGQVTLPPPKSDPIVIDEDERRSDSQNQSVATTDNNRPVDPPKTEKTKAQTPADWVKAVKAEMDRTADLDRLDEYWDGKRDHLARLKAQDPALWQDATDAYHYRRDALKEGRLV